LLDIAARAAMDDFDRARPLWEYTLVEGLPGGRAAFVLKVHHSMTDGVGGMRLLLLLVDLERKPVLGADEADPVALPVFSPLGLLANSIEWQARRGADSLHQVADWARSAFQRVREDPAGALENGIQAASSVARFLAPATTPRSPLFAERSLDRRVARFRFPLEALKRAAKAAEGSVNDAFVAGVVGGLRHYHDRHDVEVDELRMIMPINIRVEGSALGGNHFTPARLLVPMTIDDPVERIREINQRSIAIREEPAVGLSENVAGLLNRMPRRMATLLFGSMLKGADFVTSNVPGSPVPLYVCGSKVEEMYAFAPLSGGAANITLVSHCGKACIGITTDARAIPDIKRFKKAIKKGLEEILALG
jgi:WS/DGAT/MGAT family acyltransferase